MTNITNFRDIGGVSGLDGKKVKSGMLFRSGEIYQLSPEDQNFLKDQWGIKLIVDLRSKDEKSQRPDTMIEGIKNIQIDVLADDIKENGSLQSMMLANKPADSVMESVYRNLVTEDSAHKGYKEFLELLLEPTDSPILFHCFAGKDRTGFGAAIILKLLGVSEEDIYKDYILTNEMRKAANKEMLIQIQKMYKLSDEIMKRVEPMLDVKKEYLEAAFKTIDEKYGDFKTYVVDILGFSEDKIKKLQELYLI